MWFVSEKLLIYRAKRNDRQALRQIIDTNYSLVYRFLLKLCGNQQQAEDLTQECFVKCWQKIKQFSGRSRLSTWLCRIAYRLYLDTTRRKQLSFSNSDEADRVAVSSDESALENRDLIKTVYNYINQLPDKYRTVLILHYQEEFSIRDIANILEIPGGTVKSRLNEALRRVRKYVLYPESQATDIRHES